MRAPELCRAADITYRQLDHWCRQGYIEPYGDIGATPGSGNVREFSPKMVRKAKSMKCLIDIGFEVQLAARIAGLLVNNPDTKSVHIGHGVTVLIEPHTHKE